MCDLIHEIVPSLIRPTGATISGTAIRELCSILEQLCRHGSHTLALHRRQAVRAVKRAVECVQGCAAPRPVVDAARVRTIMDLLTRGVAPPVLVAQVRVL